MEIRGLLERPIRPQGLNTGTHTKKGPVIQSAQPSVNDTVSIRFGKTRVERPEGFMDELKQKGVLVSGGGGVMGSGIAINHMNSGIPVSIHDIKDAFVQGGVDKIEKSLGEAQKRGLLSEERAGEVRSHLKGAFSNDTMAEIPKDTAFFIEAIFENPEAKKALFEKMDKHLDDKAILATNTSSLSVDELASATERPDRFIGLHFFNPPHKNRFVEIIPGKQTSAETVEKTKTLVRALGKVPVMCEDSPGFVVNRMLVPLMNEGVKIYDEWVNKELAAYALTHRGQQPPAKERAVIEKRAATTIEQAAREVLWPTYSQKPEAAGMLLGPFSGLNRPEYMGLIGEISGILEKGLGEAYKPAATVLEKAKAFSQLNRRDADFQENFQALQFTLGGPEEIDQQRMDEIRDRLTGLMIGVATQLTDEGVTTPEDVNRGVMLGTRWETAPFELINKIGSEKALALVENYAETNPAFAVPQTLKTQAASNKPFALNYVESRQEGDTQIITINKPQRHNALDAGMLDSLRQAFRAAEKDKSVKTIVFESIGGKHFVSGADLPALQDNVAEVAQRYPKRGLPKKANRALQNMAVGRHALGFVQDGYKLMNEIAASKKVTVAKVNGTALGGGSELPLACDYIVASEEARFGLPEEKYGIYPAWGGTEFLKERVGTAMSAFMVHEGGLMDNKGNGPAILSAAEALAIGMVDQVVPATDLDQAVNEALDKGEFAEKRTRLKGSEAEALMDERISAEANPRLAAKLKQYREQFIDDLMKGDLKPYYMSPKRQEQLKQVNAELKSVKNKLSSDSIEGAARQQSEEKLNALREQRGALLGQSRRLEGIYRSVTSLADRRIREDEAPGRLQQWRDLKQMLTNMQKLERAKKQPDKK